MCCCKVVRQHIVSMYCMSRFESLPIVTYHRRFAWNVHHVSLVLSSKCHDCTSPFLVPCPTSGFGRRREWIPMSSSKIWRSAVVGDGGMTKNSKKQWSVIWSDYSWWREIPHFRKIQVGEILWICDIKHIAMNGEGWWMNDVFPRGGRALYCGFPIHHSSTYSSVICRLVILPSQILQMVKDMELPRTTLVTAEQCLLPRMWLKKNTTPSQERKGINNCINGWIGWIGTRGLRGRIWSDWIWLDS